MSGYGRALAGFVAGAADYGVDRIQAREKLDMELKKTKLLADLQKETEKEMAVFRDKLDKAGYNKDLSSIDYTTGEKIMRDGNGQEIGRTKLSASDMEAYALDKKKAELDNQNVESTITSRSADDRRADERLGLDRMSTAASVEASRASSALSRKQTTALDGSKDEGDNISTIAEGLRTSYKDTINAVVEDGVPQETVNLTALEIAKRARSEKWSKALAEYNFQKAIAALRSSSDKGGAPKRVNTRTKLDGTQ